MTGQTADHPVDLEKIFETVISDVADERARQDQQRGGIIHDLALERVEWLDLFYLYLPTLKGEGSWSEVRARWIYVAALAIAAVETIDVDTILEQHNLPVVSLVPLVESWHCAPPTRMSDGSQDRRQHHAAAGTAPRPRVLRVGFPVWYFAYGTPGGEFPAGVPRAAVITEVDDPGNPASTVGLCVLNPTGQFFNRGLAFTATRQPGCWGWPEDE